MKRTLALGAVAVLTSTLLVGCGGSDTQAYCDDLKAAKSDLGSFSSGAETNFADAIDAVHKLADEAPDNVADDWKTLDDALTKLEDALDEAGLSPDDLDALSSGQMPDGVDPAKLQDLMPTLTELSSTDLTEAADAIEKDAKDTCDVDLGSEG